MSHFISFLSEYQFIFDVIALSKTWLRKGEEIFVPGYNFYPALEKLKLTGVVAGWDTAN